ncbi:MAG: GDP-mannose 4,6-dehydratase [Planctomycetes bacterium]|nr:GDP-mannose 4,6-dehydratase [Planctomycetota bacterium]
MKRRALIVGATGQDGSYLAKLLLEQGYDVHGTTTGAVAGTPRNWERLGIEDRVVQHTLRLPDEPAARALVRDVQPDEIYGLGGPSSVGRSFAEPLAAFEGITLGTLCLLEAVRSERPTARLYTASSSEMFGDVGGAADEDTPLRPISPYAAAKVAAHEHTRQYRERFGLFAATGILFNHESPLRPAGFVTQKIVAGALRAASGDTTPLALGDLSIRRDWGWAPDYVEAMHAILRHDRAGDFVVATGAQHSLEDLVRAVYAEVGLDWREHVRHDPGLVRPQEIRANVGNPARARRELGWEATKSFDVLVKRLVSAARDGGA